MSSRLSGKVAFVTMGDGAGSDVRSQSLARALVGEGALVVLVAPDPEAGGRLAGAVGARAVFCPSEDVEADVSALVELAGDLVGRDDPGPPPA